MAPERPSCPRCESRNTKFCYYNNYNLSQPRHFCKSCRRYWTLGGSLRNIPAGGTSRKNAAAASAASCSYSHSSKRRRVRPSSSSAASSPPSPASPVSGVPYVDGGANGPSITDVSSTADISGTFAGLLAEPLPLGLLALGDPFLHGRTGAGFDLDIGLGFGGIEEMGFGLGRSSLVSTSASASAWPFLSDEAGEVVVGGIRDTWNVTGREACDDHPGRGDGGFFSWGNPETAEKNVQSH